MYHYVRNNEDYNYDFYTRRKDEFKAQIDFFCKNSKIIDPGDLDQIIFYLRSESENAFLLTFDDGYKDHMFCAKYLNNLNLKAIFFPPIKAIEMELMDVNLIHILLGLRKIKNSDILNKLKEICNKKETKLNFKGKVLNIHKYIEVFHNEDKFDNNTNQIIKKILQRDIINYSERKIICKDLFKEFTNLNLKDEAHNLYLNLNDMLEMKSLGMYFGSHGTSHIWLGEQSYKLQYKDIEDSFNYLINNNLILKNDLLIMCYPYGSYNKDTISILKNMNVNYAVTTNFGSASLLKRSSLKELNRWDTNHYWDDEFRKPILPKYK